MKRIVVVAIACLLLGHGFASARGMYQVYGQGTLSCGRWTEDNRAGRDKHLQTWVIGFVSGACAALAASKVELRQTDSDAMAAWIDQYCAAHPLETVGTATEELVLEFARTR